MFIVVSFSGIAALLLELASELPQVAVLPLDVFSDPPPPPSNQEL